MAKVCEACRKHWPTESPPTEPTPVLLRFLPKPGTPAEKPVAVPKQAPPAPHNPEHCIYFEGYSVFKACCMGRRRIDCSLYEIGTLPLRNVTGAACRQCGEFERDEADNARSQSAR